MALKECFGQLANLSISFNNSTQKHYLRQDDVKLRECDECSLFNKCMFLRYNALMKEMLEIIDENVGSDKTRRLG
ncbi:MAG TPA: hypothetical protein EYN96_05585 [Candidatus Hydrogenedentes bacterium]|jgi:hypothetical protein|nr:hypothetical protein [Candidatus Hydrogenedentota bacterium]HIB54757.1 hypothetical protein [Nitrospirales bacterium]